MEAAGAVVVLIMMAAIVVFGAFLLIVFPVWMLVHAGVRTSKMWPDDAVKNLLLVIVIFFASLIGALIYYFAVYRDSKNYLPMNAAPQPR